jgi:hypothetical protein
MKKCLFTSLLIFISIIGFSQKNSYDVSTNLTSLQKQKLDDADLNLYRYFSSDRTILVDGVKVNLYSVSKMSSKGHRFSSNEVELAKTREVESKNYSQKVIPSLSLGLNVSETEDFELKNNEKTTN